MKNLLSVNLISLKDLARLIDNENFQRTYNNIRQRARRGKYKSYQLIKGEGYIDKNDSAIPVTIQTVIQNESKNVTLSEAKSLNQSTTADNRQPITDNQNELSDTQQQIALARVDLLNAYLEYSFKMKDYHGSTVTAKHRFVILYNNKAFPILFDKLGRKTFKTIERWKKIYDESGKDYRSLAPQYKTGKATSVTPQESDVLTKLFLNPNQPLISEVVRQSIDIFIARRFDNIKSPHTYRRYLEDWKAEHYADYVFFREGEKALDDKILPYLERDYNKIQVGDIIVADGHTLNFEIINPYTGKPKRMTMVLFLDMKSSMPLGWDISPTENVMTIAIALRRSILRLGKFPKIIYLDNGRAFGAKFFNGVDFRTAGITGLFERIGAKVITAIPYHAQSKTVERFFKSFAEIERLMPSYSGTSIELKPPRMNRGEKLHMKLYEKFMHGTSIDVFTAHNAVAWWFDQYAARKQQDGHLKGSAPSEVFALGKGPGVNRIELIHLMMSEEIKTIYRNGIRLFNTSYWNEALFGKDWSEVLIRYDLLENDSIFVYDRNGDFICEAKRVDKVHPAAGILGTEEDVKLLNQQLQQKQSLKKLIVGDAKQFLADEIYPAAKKQFKEINIVNINQEEQKTIEQPKKKKKTIDERWADPEQKKSKTIDSISKAAEA